MRELGGGDEGAVLDLHAVMGFVAGLEAAEDADRVFDARLADIDGLEAALQGRVFFDVLAIFVERGRADAAELAAGQGRLEQVGRRRPPPSALPAPTTVCSSSMNRMTWPVDSWTSRMTALSRSSNSPRYLRAGDEQAHVEGDDAAVLQALRHVALDDAQGEAFDDGRLADARLADEHGVVLRAAREDLNDAADFLVAADDRIELARRAPFRPGRCRIFAGPGYWPSGFWSVTRALPRTDLQRFENVLVADAVDLQQVFGRRIGLRQGEQQVLDRDELVLHRRRLPSAAASSTAHELAIGHAAASRR